MPFPNKDTQFQSGEEAVENGKKGGIASGEARRKKKLLSELINKEFEKDITVNDETMTRKELAALRLIRMINDPETNDKSFLKALEFARDTIGEKPVEKVEVNKIDEDVKSEVNALLKEYEQKYNNEVVDE